MNPWIFLVGWVPVRTHVKKCKTARVRAKTTTIAATVAAIGNRVTVAYTVIINIIKL